MVEYPDDTVDELLQETSPLERVAMFGNAQKTLLPRSLKGEARQI